MVSIQLLFSLILLIIQSQARNNKKLNKTQKTLNSHPKIYSTYTEPGRCNLMETHGTNA
jgi:hypothetical protein